MYRVLTIEEATPLLLDRSLSPVVSLDTEFDIATGALHGVSIAGGTPEAGFFGCFWSFVDPYIQVPYSTFFETVIKPLFGDPERIVVMHPISVDIKKLRKRGLTDALTRCTLEDTIAQTYIYDDNLPHGLKDLAYCILLKTTATSYKVTQREIQGIRKQASGIMKEQLALIWEVYKTERKKSDVIEAKIDPTWPGWKRLAMSLPPGLNKTTSAKTGRKGISGIVLPILESVIQRDYDQRAQDRFELYGAEDAIYTLMLRYHLKPTFSPLQLEHLELETKVTHPCVTEMEERGLKIDIPLMEEIATAMRASIEALGKELHEAWTLPGDEKPFNPASPDQVAKRIWLDWGLSPPSWAKERNGGIRKKYKRAKDGLCKADALILETMAKKYESNRYGQAIQALLDYRRWNKLYGTYVEPMLEMAKNDPDGRIHSSFWPTGARSGRFSSREPNVENIPRPTTMPTIDADDGALWFHTTPDNPPRGFVLVKNKDGAIVSWRVRSLRDVFIPPDGYLYVSADLSQIENRLTAFESRDVNMLKLYREWDCFECKAHGECNSILHSCPECGAAEGKRNKKIADQPVVRGFVHGKDIHSATAAYLGFFEKYGASGRQQAKPVNHGATYGMGANTFSKKEGVPVKDANDRLSRWHETYPAVRGSLDRAYPGTLHHSVAEAITEVGEVVMFDGHLRRFHAQRLLMRSGNFRSWEWEAVIREGVNVKMQGGTGVGTKRAMLAIRQRIIDNGWWGRVFLVNQVHDELLYECAEELADELLAVINYELEHAFPELDVPVLSEGGTGSTWGEAH